MTPDFDRTWERREYLDETLRFIENEFAYAAYMVSTLKRGDHRDRLFAPAAENYLRSLREAKDAALQSTPSRPHQIANELQTFLENFPALMRTLTAAMTQRREDTFPRPVIGDARTMFAPSEVAIEYPVTIRAAEALNEDYHSRVGAFYEPWPGSGPPLVNIAGGTAASLQTQTQIRISRKLEDSCRQMLNFSCITLPRWSPQHIRMFAIAAHEHIHRVLRLVELAREEIDSVFVIEQRATEQPNNSHDDTGGHADERHAGSDEASMQLYLDVSDRFEKEVGERILALHKLAHLFAQQIRAFLIENDIPTLPGVAPGLRAKLQRIIASHHAAEFLADTGASVIAGPAFLFAYTTMYFSQPHREAQRILQPNLVKLHQSRHPPTVVRCALQHRVLLALGFKTVAQKAAPGLGGDWAELSAGPELIRKYDSFLRRGHLRQLLDEVLKLFIDVASASSSSGCYSLVSQGQEEGQVLTRWKAIATRIEETDGFSPEDLAGASPADLINAIWWKRCLSPGQRPRNRLAWRVALRNCHKQYHETAVET